MSDIAIRVRNLSKQYTIGETQARYKTLRDSLISAFKYLAPGNIKKSEHLPSPTIWALNDVSFDIHQGEVVGIIGRNGAGKSTLLKVLAHITNPTQGRVEIHGRVGSLLEVGTGFSQELTGRENTYLNGAILGMKRAEIERKFDEIVAFAEIEKFLDTPVKHYSSGMYMRLAFAVAAHLEPEILLVDEVLAVGDSDFQKKCLGKMNDISKEGRTVLFVSHNLAAVQQLCQRGLLINQGKIAFSGDVPDVIREYLQKIQNIQGEKLEIRKDRKGDQFLSFVKVGFYDSNGQEVSQVLSGQDLYIRFFYTSAREVSKAKILIAFNLRSSQGYLLANLNSEDTGDENMYIFTEGYFQCEWRNFNLRSGLYDCNLFCSVNGEIADWLQSAFSVKVEDGDFYSTGRLIMRGAGDVLVSHHWVSLPVNQVNSAL